MRLLDVTFVSTMATPLEKKNFTLRFLGSDILSRCEICECEENGQSNDNAQVSVEVSLLEYSRICTTNYLHRCSG